MTTSRRYRISEAELDFFRRFIRRRSGVELPPSRNGFLGMRLRARLNRLGFAHVGEYRALLEDPAQGDREYREFIETIVIPETYFYRTAAHFTALRRHILPELKRSLASDSRRRLTLWSAGCSTGPEAYTMAMVGRLWEEASPGWSVQVLGTDLSRSVLQQATEGFYGERAVRPLPPELFQRFIEEDSARGRFGVREEVRQVVHFVEGNLLTCAYPKPLDVIFCRNVLIYFHPKDREAVCRRFHRALPPGGYLVLGHSETLREFPDLFEVCWSHDTFFYRRKDPQQAPRADTKARARPARTRAQPASGASRKHPAQAIYRGPDTRILMRRSERKPSKAQEPAILELEGNLSEQTGASVAGALKKRFLRLAEQQCRWILLIMDRVTFLDAAGLSFLRRAIRLIQDYGGHVAAVSGNQAVRRWLEKLTAEKLLKVYETEAQARASRPAPSADSPQPPSRRGASSSSPRSEQS